MAQTKVRVTAAINPPLLLVDYFRQLTLNGTALVRVEASSSLKSFAPVDVVMLLNVSHGMGLAAASTSETPPSRLELLKKAVKFVIRQLGDDDRLAIVAFNDRVIKEHSTGLLEISGANRITLEGKVDSLTAKGDTAFRPSLEHAVELLDARVDKSRVGFIILVSDGSDNNKFEWTDDGIAPTDKVQILLRRYTVHTLGLCKAHDCKALHFIAKESCGTYSSITDGNDLESKIMEAFAICLAGLKTVVAVDTCINIKSGILNIKRIDSGGYAPRGGSGSIFIGVLYAGEVKDLVVYFDYTTGFWQRGYTTVLSGITANVTYKDVTDRQSTITETCSVSLPIHTTDTGRAPENPCPPFSVLLLQMVRSKVVDLLKSVLKELLVLKQEAGGAIKREEDGDPVLQAMAASLLQRKWKEFKQSDGSWEAAPRAFLDLGGIDNDINAMVGILKQGLGVGCIYSWLSSYQMQRETVTGLPPVHTCATGFSTPAMDAMVREVHRQLAKEAPTQEEDEAVCCNNNAVELLDKIDERFELWSKLEHDVPPPFQPSSARECDESRNYVAVLNGDISRARKKDIYLATDRAIEQWRGSFTAGEK